VRLEEQLGVDPFSSSESIGFPATLSYMSTKMRQSDTPLRRRLEANQGGAPVFLGCASFGGLKVHAEEIEAAINRHAGVSGSRAKAHKSPLWRTAADASSVAASRDVVWSFPPFRRRPRYSR
jgi:hypothetical protein